MDNTGVNAASMSSSMASAFAGRSTAKSADELRKARETRASEALRMKDEQLKILSEQNQTLLSSLDKVSWSMCGLSLII